MDEKMRCFWFVGARMLLYIVVFCDIDELNIDEGSKDDVSRLMFSVT